MTNIEWTHPPGYKGDSWNPVVGCSRKSTGCEHCYAEVMAARIANANLALARAGKVLTPTQDAYMKAVVWERGGYDGPKDIADKALPKWSRKLFPLPHKLDYPLGVKAPTCFFVNSMSDLFHEDVPFNFIDQVFAMMALTPQHFYLILTKRPERMALYMEQLGISAREWQDVLRTEKGRYDAVFTPSDVLNIRWLKARENMPSLGAFPNHPWPLPNVGLGTSVENQATATERIPHLLRVPAALRFLSCEPLVGPIDFRQIVRASRTDPATGQEVRASWPMHHTLDWVITGLESGPNARAGDVAWPLNIIGQCKDAGIPVFNKQLGKHPYTMTDCNTQPPAKYQAFLRLKDKKGGDMAEWPEALRVREWPKALLGRNANTELLAGHAVR